MTDIEKAIYDICGNCSTVYGSPECLSAICSKRICVTALKEKAEREKGCEYTCTDDDNNEWECSNCNDSIVLYDDNPFVNGFVFCSNCGLPIKSLDYTKYDFETDKYINYILTVDDYISGKPAAEI